MKPDRLSLLHEVADSVAAALAGVTDFGPSGGRRGQYGLDVVANQAALAVLRRAGVGALSEESEFEPGLTGEVVVIDPIDGSTNASRGVRYFATALCLVDADGPAVALVANQATGERYWAQRGGGAWCDGARLHPSHCCDVSDAIIGLNGMPPSPLGYSQFRALGAVALDLCHVSAGVLDGYVDCVDEAHGVWDYLAAVLVCREAGAEVADLHGRDLVVLDHAARRTPIAAATPDLLAQLTTARRGYAERPIEGA
ncbi:MAG: inositol monophosphatase [Actinobacteria bacterium]|nr:inositol monophosphatase [Actinomycetota bacterium]